MEAGDTHSSKQRQIFILMFSDTGLLSPFVKPDELKTKPRQVWEREGEHVNVESVSKDIYANSVCARRETNKKNKRNEEKSSATNVLSGLWAPLSGQDKPVSFSVLIFLRSQTSWIIHQRSAASHTQPGLPGHLRAPPCSAHPLLCRNDNCQSCHSTAPRSLLFNQYSRKRKRRKRRREFLILSGGRKRSVKSRGSQHWASRSSRSSPLKSNTTYWTSAAENPERAAEFSEFILKGFSPSAQWHHQNLLETSKLICFSTSPRFDLMFIH